MERVALTALEADVLKLAIAAVALLAVALVLIVFFGARAIQGILAAQTKLLDAYQQIATAIHNLTMTLTSLTNDIRIFQQSMTAGVAALHGDLRQYINTSEERHKTIVEQIEEAAKKQVDRIETLQTDLEGVAGRLIDSSVAQIASQVGQAVQPLLQDFGVIRTSIEQIEQRRAEQEAEFQRQRIQAEEQYRADIQAVWNKVAETQQKLVQTMGSTIIAGGATNENVQQQPVGDRKPDLPDTGKLSDPDISAGRSDSRADGAAASDHSAAPGGSGAAATGAATSSDATGDRGAASDPATDKPVDKPADGG